MKTNCKVCAECGATFTAYTARAKYCSTNCSKAAARKKSTKAAEKRHENLQAAINAAKERRNKNGNLKNNSEES